ncbi:hypothetical protein niasHT_024291 [Heterodera trifolii]|uniref:ZP domain-containing protein n=1 Tax=Heterodera trifolii TaxID=157864 RepID=A0ABD2JM61_9BILA
MEGGNRVKIMAECANEQMTLHVQFNEDTLQNGRFTDWIIVGMTTRPECRLKGNGELRYIVQIAVLKDPCATKLMAPGVFQNTLRIASFPGLILSDDLNFEFKCSHGTPEIWELRLPQNKRTEGESNGEQLIVPIRPPPLGPTPSSSSDRAPSSLTGDGGGLDQNLLASSASIAQQKQAQKNKFAVTEGMSTGNAWTEQKTEGDEMEKQRERSGRNGTGEKQQQKQRGQQQQQVRKEAELVVNNNDNFDVSNQWEERRGSNSFPSNLLVVLCGFLALFLIGCVFMAIFQTIKQFRATRRAAPFAQLDSRTSPESDGSRERVGMEWRAHVANSDTTTARTNEARDQLQLGAIEGSYHTEELNLEPPSVAIPTVPLHSSTKIYGGSELRQSNTMKAFGNAKDEHSEDGPKMRNYKGTNERQRDNQTIRRGEFNAAACRSITEIYRTAEIKLKSMIKEAEEEGKQTGGGGPATGDYSTLKKLDPLKERESLLISCVNKIRGYGSRKLTEQEILRWRQLIRNDPHFQSRVFASVSEEGLMNICELPQYRVLFTRMKWARIMGCIAEEILEKDEEREEKDEREGEGERRQSNGSADTVRRMKPLPALPGPTKFSSTALSQHQKPPSHPNGSLNIFVGNANSGAAAER